MKITIYTVTDCQFSKAEKEYLGSHNLPYEEKNLEQNRQWLAEMLAVSNNFAGTPVTKIEKDDGQIVVLKGFTKEEFDQTLGFGNLVQPPTSEAQSTIKSPPPPPPLPSSPSSSTSPPSTPPAPSKPPSSPTPSSFPSNSPTYSSHPQTDQSSQALNSILENLKTKANSPNPSSIPNIPDFPKER